MSIAKIRSILPYVGGKYGDLDHIYKVLKPMIKPNTVFVDCFGGSGTVALNVKNWFPDITIVYNDLSPSTVSCINYIINNDYETIMNDLKRNPTDAKNKFREKKPLIDYEMLLLIKKSFHGIMGSGHLDVSRGVSINQKNLQKFKEIFSNIIIENIDYQKLVDKYKSDSSVLFYMDPPYISTYVGDYTGRFDKSDYDKILEIMKKSTVILHIEFIGYSYDKFKDYLKYYYAKNYSLSSNKIPKYIAMFVS